MRIFIRSAFPPRRTSDFENEHLLPEPRLFDAEEAKAFLTLHAHSPRYR